jgi:hypothetical protein
MKGNKMEYPKKDALVMGFKTLDGAVTWATKKRKFGGCFEQQGNLFVCYWLPKGHVAISNFAW